MTTDATRRDVVPFREAVRTWFAVSLQTFGGPAGQIAVMHRVLVEEKRWVGEQRFLHALSYCTLLPGPEAQQLATYLGWLLGGIRGGLVAGVLFVLPGVVALLALSALYMSAGDSSLVSSVFAGLAAAVLAIVVHAVHRVAGRALGHPALVAIAVAAFAALWLFAIPFPVVVAVAAAAGWLLGRLRPSAVRRGGHGTARDDDGPPPLVPDDTLHHTPPGWGRTATTAAIGVLAWGAPLLGALALGGRHGVLTEMGLFFSGAAVVTFGGAYAVLAYVAQQAVATYGWLGPGEMVRGLALAETTPGPLIMVVQFVAFVGAYRHPGTLAPWAAAVLASVLVTWVTFVPSILFVLLGAPYVEALRGNTGLSAALAGITASVVGVIANLAVYFALHTLFADVGTLRWGPLRLQAPDVTTLRPAALGIAVVAAVLLFGRKWSVLRVLGVSAVLGLLAALVPGSGA